MPDVLPRPVIGITVGRDLKNQNYLRLRRSYPGAVERAGGAPILLPPVDDASLLPRLLGRLDGILFPGGSDVEPSHYGAEPHQTTQSDPVVDDLDLEAARIAMDRGLPTLGICRGQQLLNVAHGGTLYQDLPSEGIAGHRTEGARTELAHVIDVAPDSRLGEILGSTCLGVNSFHHQAIRDLGTGLRPVAWAPDGIVEGIESTEHPWLLAVQFHPEDLIEIHDASQRLLRAFARACAERAAAR